jgi:hypothetical protein
MDLPTLVEQGTRGGGWGVGRVRANRLDQMNEWFGDGVMMRHANI